MVDVKNAFKKGEPITGRPCNLARELFKEIQGDKSIGEALDLIIRTAAESLNSRARLIDKGEDLLKMWDDLDKVGQKYNNTEG